MKLRLLLALLLPLCLVTVALADDKADMKDLETGTWKVTSLNEFGKETPKELLEKVNLTFTFAAGKLKVSTMGETKEGTTFKIDSSKTPKEVDMKAEKEKDIDKAIYEIDKDTLKIALGKSERPKDFKAGKDIIVFTLERKK